MYILLINPSQTLTILSFFLLFFFSGKTPEVAKEGSVKWMAFSFWF